MFTQTAEERPAQMVICLLKLQDDREIQPDRNIRRHKDKVPEIIIIIISMVMDQWLLVTTGFSMGHNRPVSGPYLISQ